MRIEGFPKWFKYYLQFYIWMMEGNVEWDIFKTIYYIYFDASTFLFYKVFFASQSDIEVIDDKDFFLIISNSPDFVL